MSQDEQQHRGGFVPVGELAYTLPGFEARGRAMSAQARHHFTTLHQVNQLVEASEAEPDLGFMARLLALCSLPRTNPGDRKEYVRRNGPCRQRQRVTSRGSRFSSRSTRRSVSSLSVLTSIAPVSAWCSPVGSVGAIFVGASRPFSFARRPITAITRAFFEKL